MRTTECTSNKSTKTESHKPSYKVNLKNLPRHAIYTANLHMFGAPDIHFHVIYMPNSSSGDIAPMASST